MIVLFVRSLMHRWLEIVLTSVVVAAVIATLTTQRALSSSTETQVHELAHKLGKNMLVVPEATNLSSFYAMEYGNSSMPDTYADLILNSELRTPISLIQSRLYGNVKPSGVPLVLVGEETRRRGRVQNPFSSDRVRLGNTAADKLAAQVEDRLDVNGIQLTVAGVTEKPPDGLDIGVFGPLDLAQDVLDKPAEINAMRLAGCWCRLDVPKLALQVEETLPGSRAVTIAGMLKAQKGTVATAKRYSKVAFAITIALIAAIVVGLLASQVKRQIRQIGLLLATGSSPWFVVLLFICKAAVIGLLGGFGGYYLGFPLTEDVAARMIGVGLPVPSGLLLPTVALALVVSVVAAVIPAIWAARLDPTRVLREV
ncbi:MAG: FtsX-like permease family protein [Phycisphaerae bacterium]